MELLRFEDRPVTSWKNGGGLTREIAVHLNREIHPEFLWRVSMATVSTPGPFSRFDGIDRTIAVLQGQGILLHSGGHEVALDQNGAPYSFAGEVPIYASVMSGETTDLNVMTRRGYFTHAMKRLVIGRSMTIDIECDEMIVAFNGHVAVETPEHRLAARPLDVLTGMKRGARISLLPEQTEEIFLIELSRIATAARRSS